MTAQINPTSTTQPALFNSPTLEFNAPPTRENLTAIARLGDVAARVRFSIQARGVERFKPNPRSRRESTRPVEGTLELTVRVVGREQAPIVMTERTIYNTLEIYRRFEGQLFKLEVIRLNTYGKTERVCTLEDVQQKALREAQLYSQPLQQCRTQAERVETAKIL